MLAIWLLAGALAATEAAFDTSDDGGSSGGKRRRREQAKQPEGRTTQQRQPEPVVAHKDNSVSTVGDVVMRWPASSYVANDRARFEAESFVFRVSSMVRAEIERSIEEEDEQIALLISY